MPAETRTMKNYELTDETIRQIKEIAAEQHGLPARAVVEWAIDHLHRSVCGPAPARLPVAGLSPNRRESNRQAAERELMRPAARPAGPGRSRTGKPAT